VGALQSGKSESFRARRLSEDIASRAASKPRICRAVFDNVSASVDPVIAIEMGAQDSDGDGYSDYLKKIFFLHSEARIRKGAAPPRTIAKLSGVAGASAVGNWSV